MGLCNYSRRGGAARSRRNEKANDAVLRQQKGSVLHEDGEVLDAEDSGMFVA